MVLEITKANFEAEVIKSEKPVLIDFWASWCGPCKMMAPVVDEIAEEREDVKVCKVNVDDEEELAVTFGVEMIPTIILVKNGKAVDKSIGVVPKSKLISMIDN